MTNNMDEKSAPKRVPKYPTIEDILKQAMHHAYDVGATKGEEYSFGFAAVLEKEIDAIQEQGREERDKQILAWYTLPIKTQEDGKLGPIMCDTCGGQLHRIRGSHPNEPGRIACPTCAIEILESIYSNLSSASAVQARSLTPNSPQS